MRMVLRYSFCYERRGGGGGGGGGCLMGPDEQPSVQLQTAITLEKSSNLSVVILRFIFKLNLNTFSMYNKSV